MSTKGQNKKNQALRIATAGIFYMLSWFLFTKIPPIADQQIIQYIAFALLAGGSIIFLFVLLSYALNENGKEDEISLAVIAVLVLTMIVGCLIYWMAINYAMIDPIKKYMLFSRPIVCIMFVFLIAHETLTVFMRQKT